MKILYATHFQIFPRSDETASTAFERINIQINSWIIDWYARNRHQVTIPPGDQVVKPLPDHSISVRTQGPLADGTTQTRVFWRRVDSKDNGIYWQVNGTLTICQGCIELGITVSLAAVEFRPLGKALPIGRPRIVRDLLVSERCSVSNFPITIRPHLVPESEVGDFVEGFLCSPYRTLPVLMISPDIDGSFLLESRDLADRLAGLCTVVELQSQAATFRLTAVVGRALNCFNGAVRLYWPGLSTKSDPWQHPLFMPVAVRHYQQTRSGFHGQIIDLISAALSLRSVPGPVTRQASVAFAKVRRDEIEELKSRYEKGLADFKEFEPMLKLVEEERDTYKEELEKAKNQVDFLLLALEEKTQELKDVKENWNVYEDFSKGTPEAVLSQFEEEEEIEEGIFSNVKDAVCTAKDEFVQNLEVLESAIESAATCPFRNPGRIYQTLQAINDICISWKTTLESKSSMGGGLVQAFKLRGFDFKNDISQTCRTKFENDYKFMYQGKRQMFAQHITDGSGNPNSCFSVHMLFDEAVKKVIIAYVGIHRRNTST
jgi:hypothetical protein